MTVKALTEDTFSDAKSVIEARFSDSAVSVLSKTMANPLRQNCPEIGEIAYDETGRAVGFRAANRRRMHFVKEPLLGRVRGLTCRLKDSSKDVMRALCEAQLANPRGCKIAFSNTQSIPTERRAVQMGATLGPESCTRMLCSIIRPMGLLVYLFFKKVLKCSSFRGHNRDIYCGSDFRFSIRDIMIQREQYVDKKFFDALNANYILSNNGLVSDRDGESVSWLFGDDVEQGRVVLLCAYKNGIGVGYIALKTDAIATHWLVVDWFALRNDSSVLSALLKAAKRFLRQCTPALACKVIGFPEYVQPLLRKHFPFVRKSNVNWFSYNFLDDSLAEKCRGVIHSEDSWFFGPFDGDLCM